MILTAERKQRNYNYLTIISKYNKLLSTTPDKKITHKQFEDFKKELSINLLGFDSVEAILNSIVDDSDEANDNLALFTEDESGYTLAIEDKISPVASKEEALIVFSMLNNGDFDLFLSDEQRNNIKNNIDKYFDNLSMQPINLYDYIEDKGKSLCADNLKEIKDTFDILKETVESKKTVKISYYFNDVYNEHIIMPIGFVYSQLDLRMRVKAYCEDSTLQTFYISNIKKVEVIDDIHFEISNAGAEYKELVFSFENSNNRAERIAARFSDYRKSVKLNKKKNIITYHVFYENNPTESNRIFYRLRSLGRGINIQTEEKGRVVADAKKALENYKNGTKFEK